MTIRTNPELALILKTASSKYDQLRKLDTALTSNKRVKARRAPAGTLQRDAWAIGTLFRDAALTGGMAFSGVDISSLGVTSDLTTCLAADLSTGVSVLRIEGGGHWLEGSLGLPNSGADFILPTNPTTSNSFAIAGTLRLKGAFELPDGMIDTTPPIVSLAVASASVSTSGPFALTASAVDNVGVAKVEFYRDGNLIGSVSAAPWAFNDTLTSANNGTRSYTAKAFDIAGNSTTSAAQGVSVNIAAPTNTGPAAAIGAQIAPLTVDNTSSSSATNVPFTIGHSFLPGHLPGSGAGISLQLADNSLISSQLDVKALHADGSVRHALISGVVPSMTANESKAIKILRRDASADAAPPATTLAAQVAAGLEATVAIVDSGTTYTVKLSDLAAGASTRWMTGSVANEWLLFGPLKNASGSEHPLIHARFHVRSYAGLSRARIHITLENSWVIPAVSPPANGNAFVSNNPGDVTYDVTVTVPGDPGYTQAGLVHYNRARWTRTYWWNGASVAHVRHNVPYILSTRAVPNYDPTKGQSSSTIAGYVTQLSTSGAPMQNGLMLAAQGSTGGRPDIGLNPGWCVNWLLTGNKDAKDVSVRTSLLAGSWPTHFRNKATGNWVDIRTYPYACLSKGSSSDDQNPATTLHEMIPAAAVNNPNIPNDAHEPNHSYIPYLLTGDFIHLEELQAWNEWNAIQQLPGYRKFGNGAVFHQQARGLAWLTRTLAHTAYISPEGDPIKARAAAALDYNLDYLVNLHVNSTDPKLNNIFGIIDNADTDAIQYPGATSGASRVGVAPWQDDFVTSSIGMVAELGFAKARPLLAWKAKFAAGRFLSGPDFCWVMGCSYSIDVRSSSTSPMFTNWTQAWDASIDARIKATACASQAMADACTTVFGDFGAYVPGQMPKYASQDDGFPANAQPAMAYVATSDHPRGADVWLVFDNRAVKPAYNDPQFAILPRTA